MEYISILFKCLALCIDSLCKGENYHRYIIEVRDIFRLYMLGWRYIDSIHALARISAAATDRIWITIRNYNPPAIYNAHNVCMYTVAFYEPSYFYVNRAILDRRERPPLLLLLSYSANSDRRPNLFRASAVNRKGHLTRRDGIMCMRTRVHVARGIFFYRTNVKYEGRAFFSTDKCRQIWGYWDIGRLFERWRGRLWDSVGTSSFYLFATPKA